MLSQILRGPVFLFPLSEIALGLLRRARPGTATVEDRGSMRVLWIVIFAAVTAAILCTGFHAARLPVPAQQRQAIALGLLVGGLALRWVSIFTLGRFFTVDVATHRDHRLIEIGPYRYVRHPSYTGLLVAFLGLGLYFANGLSILVLMVPITLALLHRIRVEEAALIGALGDAYEAYRARTKRLVPGLL